ncbi:hypothetical protein [Anaerotignum sp.]
MRKLLICFDISAVFSFSAFDSAIDPFTGYRYYGVNAATAQWIRENGYEYDGLTFNIYHVSPHETDNAEEFVTEVCYPIRKK